MAQYQRHHEDLMAQNQLLIEAFIVAISRKASAPDTTPGLANTVDLTPTTPEGFAEHIKREMPKWRKVVTEAKITSL